MTQKLQVSQIQGIKDQIKDDAGNEEPPKA